MAELLEKLFLLLSFSFYLGFTLATTCEKLDTCSCKMSDGSGIVSLQDLDNSDGSAKFKNVPQAGSTSFTFSYNPCTPLKTKDACKDNNVCQDGKPDSGFSDYPCGASKTKFTVDSSGNAVITYSSVVNGGQTRYSVITLSCDKTQSTGSFGQSGFTENKEGVQEKTSQYTATLSSKCACPGGCHYSSSYVPSSGLSVGSVLLIVFFPLLMLYFALGIIVNKFGRKKEGFPDLIPNHSFWSDFPFLIKDGFAFTFGKLRFCCSSIYHKAKGDPEYAQI